MKKIYSSVLVIALIVFSFSCNTDNETDPLDVFREIAYNALPFDVKATVVGDWRDAEVSEWINGNYLVTFESSDKVLGPIRVVVDPERGVWVEILPRP